MSTGPGDEAPASPEVVEAAVRVVVALNLWKTGEMDAAAEVLLKATQLAPNYSGAHLAYAQTLLARGDMLAGWREYVWRKPFNPKTKTLVAEIGVPEWTGETAKDCRLLVICDEGLGDAIMFARYLPLAAERVGRVVVGWGPEHSALFTGMDGVSAVFASAPKRDEFDAYVMICDLPLVFKTTLETIPAPIPYMPLNERKRQGWSARLGPLSAKGTFRVGINWAGSPAHARDAQRSLRFEQLRPLLEIDGISFISLQKEVRERDRAPLADAGNVLDVSESLEGFDDTAALIANLDLVVTVDSAVAHLAGALGATTWVLLPKPSDWRWLLDRHDSPWYPTARLFRQQRHGDWDSVLREAKQELRRLTVPDRS